MLRITIELLPLGDESKAKRLSEMVLANDGTGDRYQANYEAWISKDDFNDTEPRYGKLSNFDRSKDAWELLRLMLEAILLETHTVDEKEDSLCQRLKRKLRP
jgi:hypothetical protein